MVDIGTGYYVEKESEGGIDYCKRKVQLLSDSLQSLAEIISQKRKQVQTQRDTHRHTQMN